MVEAPGVLENDSDPDGDPLTAAEASWPSHGSLDLNSDGSFIYEHDGSDVVGDAFTYEVSDGQGGSDVGTVTITLKGAGAIHVPVSDSWDDAEERISDGSVARSGADLELGEDSAPQIVGLRFSNVQIPRGAAITFAYVEFTADETHSGTTNLTFHGEASNNAAPFDDNDYHLSSRPKTSASSAWNNVPPWTTIHATYQSADLSPIVQEIVNRDGWSPGNALAIYVTGSGRRTAESYDGEPTMAPILHVEYAPPGGCYTLSSAVDPVGSGTVSADPQPNCEGTKYLDGTAVQLTANPSASYTFSNWSGDLTTSTNPDSVTMDADKAVTAHFDSVACHSLTMAVDPPASGSVSADPLPNCPTDADLYAADTQVTLTATPSDPYDFSGWAGDASSCGYNPSCLITMDGDKSATAYFGAAHSLLTGFNLLAPNVETDPPTTAEMALDDIAAQGGDVRMLCRWLSMADNWECHVKGQPFNNYVLELGQGYAFLAEQGQYLEAHGPAAREHGIRGPRPHLDPDGLAQGARVVHGGGAAPGGNCPGGGLHRDPALVQWRLGGVLLGHAGPGL